MPPCGERTLGFSGKRLVLPHFAVQDTPNAKRSRQLVGDVLEVGYALDLGVYP